MKKLLLLVSFFMLFDVMFADNVRKMQATEYSYKTINEYGVWSSWSPWSECSILVILNITEDRINIYSSVPQEYDIYAGGGDGVSDGGGGTITTYNCIDKDGVQCDVRIRLSKENYIQLYVDYSNIMWVYNVQFK